MNLNEFDKEMRERLDISRFDFDFSLNGIQVASSEGKEIKKVALAVDACQATIDEAATKGADLLFVHHGLFWGSPLAIKGAHYNRVKTLLDSDMALYACHLPLDAHPVMGNNAQMAISLGAKEYDMFGVYHGEKIGVKCRLPFCMRAEEIAKLLGFSVEWGLKILPFGKDGDIETVGIISGAGGEDVEQAIAEGLDCYITGEVPHQVYHTALENHMTLIAGGHYQSEVFGVKAVGRMLEQVFGIDTFFIDKRTAL